MHGRANVQRTKCRVHELRKRQCKPTPCEQTPAAGSGLGRVGSGRSVVRAHLIQMIDLSPYVGIKLSMSVTARQTHATSLHCDLAAL